MAAQRMMASETSGGVGQPAVGGEPGQGSLHHPTARMDGEAALLGGFTHDLDGGCERATGPVDESAGEPLISWVLGAAPAPGPLGVGQIGRVRMAR